MSNYQVLIAAVLISFVLSGAVILALANTMRDILRQLCPQQQAADFWLRYTTIMLTIAPLLLVLLADMFSSFKDPLDTLRVAVIAVLAGLLLGLHTIGRRLNQFVAPHSPSRRAAEHSLKPQ